MISSSVIMNVLAVIKLVLEIFFDSMGEKLFRAGLVMKWILHLGVVDFDAMRIVSKGLREKLMGCDVVRGREVVSEVISSDGTRIWV
ncbi:23S rRNA (adenine(2503)-C(2))-methyltransferase RlmN, partial [Pseudomonas syringae pv. tagetis]